MSDQQATTSEDRYAVVIVSKHTGASRTSCFFFGDEGADKAWALADEWNAKYAWQAFVVGLHPEKFSA